MSAFASRLLVLVLGSAMVLTLGCDNGQARLRNDLKSLAIDYHNYHDVHRQGPPGWDELIAESSNPDSVKRVRDAGYQVTWDGKLTEMPQGTSNTVMAQKPGGGPKLMMDGSVQ
jgi:hypothetical protein